MRRSLKSGIFGALAAGFLGSVAVVGCSASGDTEDLPPATVSDQDSGKTSSLPPSSDDDDSGATDTTDAGKKKDAGKDGSADAGKDSGPTAPNSGDPCTTANKLFKRSCGKCGQQEAICQASGDGGALVVSDYGDCTNEIGTCTPGETAACGNCGTKTCSNSCNWGSCLGQPQPENCSPGSVSYTTGGCSGQTYKQRSCANDCKWGDYSLTCGAPVNPNTLTISATTNGTVIGNYALKEGQVGSRSSSYSCPGTATSGSYPYEVIEVKNATTKTATISAWLSGSPAMDTVLAAYDTNLPPQDDTAIGNCTKTNDQCPSALCTSPWSGLTGTSAVTIQAGKSIILRAASYWEVDDTYADDPTTGPFTLTVRTDALN
jgi:hypothetical protein